MDLRKQLAGGLPAPTDNPLVLPVPELVEVVVRRPAISCDKRAWRHGLLHERNQTHRRGIHHAAQPDAADPPPASLRSNCYQRLLADVTTPTARFEAANERLVYLDLPGQAVSPTRSLGTRVPTASVYPGRSCPPLPTPDAHRPRTSAAPASWTTPPPPPSRSELRVPGACEGTPPCTKPLQVVVTGIQGIPQ